MASKRRMNGRRALKDFEAHIKKAGKASQASVSPEQAEGEDSGSASRFPALTQQQIGERISFLRGQWFKKDGSIKSSGRCGSAVEFAREVASVKIDLQELETEFQRRLRESG
jgi:hypothetical protein